MAGKKGAIEKCNNNLEMINQKNKHCSNVTNMLRVRLFCVSVCICKEEYWLPMIQSQHLEDGEQKPGTREEQKKDAVLGVGRKRQ